MKFLFVCAGNTCRSVVAECVLVARAKQILGDNREIISADSCGLSVQENAPPHADCVAALDHLGIPLLEISASSITEDHLRSCDLALTMTRQQSYLLANRHTAYTGKCFSIIEANGAIETLLDERRTSIETRNWAREARNLAADHLDRALIRAAETLAGSSRALLRPLAGVPMGIREVLTLFPTCFHQVSGIHDPVGGAPDEIKTCASQIDSEVTLLLNGLLALALSEQRS